MVMDPINAWVVVRNGQVVHVRLQRGVAEACATIERDVYHQDKVEVKPVLMTEVEDVR